MVKTVFFGTPDYVIPIVKALHKHYQLVGVVTARPAAVGREKKVTYSPVDRWGNRKKIPVFYSANDFLASGIKASFGVVASFGELISANMLSHFPQGMLNIHPSLLPQWRGASPAQATILSGVSVTGVTIIKMDEEMDHGPVISLFKDEVLPEDTAETLRDRLFAKSAQFLIDLMPNYLNKNITPKPQGHSKATYAKRLTRADGFIDPNFIAASMKESGIKNKELWEIKFMNNYSLVPNANSLERFIRAMSLWPGAWTLLRTGETEARARRLKLLEAEVVGNKLVLKKVQLEGKNVVSWEEFVKGYPEFRF